MCMIDSNMKKKKISNKDILILLWEVNAYTNQILAEIYLSDTPYSNPEDVIFATETWQHIHDMLSKKSKRLIKTRVFSRLFM